MKKWIVFAVLVGFTYVTCSAQELKLGAKAGLNLATLSEDYDPDVKNRTSFHVGGVAEISLSEAFSIQPEILYSSQGAKDDGDDDEEVRLNYLTLPVLAKYYVSEGFSLEVGPQLGLLLKGEIEDNGVTTDVKDISKSTDLGIAFGLGYKFESGLNFGLRYYLGSDINDIEGSPDKIKNKVLQISVGYFFN